MPEPIDLPVHLAHPHATLPAHARFGDAGMDLASPRPVTAHPGAITRIPTGVHVAIPAGHCGFIWGRSGLASRGAAILGGLLDSGFRGEVVVLMANHGLEPIHLGVGDRVAQLVVSPCVNLRAVPVGDVAGLGETERGQGGFGSSGT